MDFEGALISKVLLERCMGDVLELRPSKELFVDYREAWEWILKSFQEHSDVPPITVVQERFPSLVIEDPGTSVSFLVDELRSRFAHGLVLACMQKQADELTSLNPYAALEAMKDCIMKAELDSRLSRDLNLSEDPESRLEDYRKLAAADGLLGIPTPWQCLDEFTQGFQPEDLIMVAGRAGSGKCVEESSLIPDPKTGVLRTIREVVEGGQTGVLSWDKDLGIVSSDIYAKVDTGRKECLEFIVESGRSIIVTPEHPFLTPEGWVRADSLGVRDHVGLPSHIPEPLETISMEDAEVVALAALLKNLGIDRVLSKNKTIPDAVFSLPNSQLARFLGIFWMTDGYVSKLGAPGISLSSEVAVRQIQHLLLRFGIQSSLRYKAIKGGKYKSWRLSVYSHSAPQFLQCIPLWGEKEERLSSYVKKRETLKTNPNVGGKRYDESHRDWEKPGVFWSRVEKVSPAGERKIYDLSVSETHSFVANGFIVHNTWCEVVLAVHCWRMGYKPLLFSREMAVSQIVRRADAVHAQLPYQRFRSGHLTSEELNRWERVLKDMKGALDFIVTGDDDGILGVSGVVAKIRKYKPDMVFIDGGYLIEDDRGAKANWERWSNVCRDLKKAAQVEKLPILLTHQFNKEGLGDKGDGDTLKYGDVKMWFDVMIGIYQSENLTRDKEALLKIIKLREGPGDLEWVSDWDLENMTFSQKFVGPKDNTKSSGTPSSGPTDTPAYSVNY